MNRLIVGTTIALSLLTLTACNRSPVLQPSTNQPAVEQVTDPLDQAIVSAAAAATTPAPTVSPSPSPSPVIVAPGPVASPAIDVAVVQPAAIAVPQLPSLTVRCGCAANVRQAPSSQAQVLSVLMDGSTVKVDTGKPTVQQSGIIWYPIVYDGDKQGWMASTLLSR